MRRRDFLAMSAAAAASPTGALAQSLPKRAAANPFLSAPVFGITHFDSAQSDTLPYRVKRGTFRIDLGKQPRVFGGPVNIMCLASTEAGYMWAISTDRVAYVDARNGGWKLIASVALPGITHRTDAELQQLLSPKHGDIQSLESLCKDIFGPRPTDVLTSGLYSLVDRDNVAYANAGPMIHAFGLKDPRDPAKGVEVKRSLDARNVFKPMSLLGSPPAVRLVGMGMTYDGRLIVGGFNGIAIVDRKFETPAVVHTIEEGQFVSNSFCVDDRNGIYLASGSVKPREDGIMRKLVWTGSRISTDEKDGAWSSPYDGGDWPPAIKAGTGTGSTPTLMGFGPKDDDRLVVIGDGSNRMKVVAFWRDRIPPAFKQRPGAKSPRIADQIQITAGLPASAPWVQSEQSVVVNGYGAFVVNNVIPQGHPDKLVDVMAVGPLIAPPNGMERIEWDTTKKRWRSAWTRADVASTSMVPVASAPSEIVFVNGYSKQDGWEITGLDWRTGRTVHRTIFGQSNFGNGAYALVQFLSNGDLLFNSIGGPYRIKLASR